MQGTTADQWKQQDYWSVLLAGVQKGAGKTTIALSAPTPIAVVSCDLGRLSIPPSVAKSQILVLPYHELTRVMGDMGTSVPQKDIYVKLMRELTEVWRAVKKGEPIKLESGLEFPTPKTVVLDGLSRLNTMLVDGKCALNGLLYADDLPKEARFKFWGTRLADVLSLTQQFASLPCNVVLTAWVDPKNDAEGKPTGVWLPDIGGKMDLLTAGLVSAALYCYSRAGKFYVRPKSDAAYPWCGIRGEYNLPNDIEVTIGADGKLPWEKIFSVAKGT